MPESVSPKRGMLTQCASPAEVCAVKCAASMETRWLASTKPSRVLGAGTAGCRALMTRPKKLLVAAVAIALAALLPVACRLASQVAAAVQPAAQIYSGGTGHSSFSRTVFLAPASGFDKDSLVFSDDGKHDAWISGSSGAQRIVADGVPGQMFSRCSGPTFSPADKLFYWAIAANRIVLIADNQVIPTPWAGEGSLDFSADGRHWVAFGAEPETQNGNTIMAGSIAVYEEGQQIGRYDDVSYPAFSADRKHLAFVATQDDRMRLIVDGKVSLTFDAPKVQSSMMFRAFVNGPNMFMLTSVHYGGDSLIALVQDADVGRLSTTGNRKFLSTEHLGRRQLPQRNLTNPDRRRKHEGTVSLEETGCGPHCHDLPFLLQWASPGPRVVGGNGERRGGGRR